MVLMRGCLSIAPGPRRTVAVGYANGVFGLWDRATGARIAHGHLHGAITHLVLDARNLYAATDLGRAARLDLGALVDPYCEVMRAVWADVPMVWRRGRPRREPPPSDHRCTP